MSESTFQAHPRTQSLIYFWRRDAAQVEEFNTFCWPILPRAKKKPLFLRDGERHQTTPRFQNLFSVSDILLCVGTGSHQSPSVGQISHILPPPVKIRERWVKCLSRKKDQSYSRSSRGVFYISDMLLHFETRALQVRLGSQIDAKFCTF